MRYECPSTRPAACFSFIGAVVPDQSYVEPAGALLNLEGEREIPRPNILVVVGRHHARMSVHRVLVDQCGEVRVSIIVPEAAWTPGECRDVVVLGLQALACIWPDGGYEVRRTRWAGTGHVEESDLPARPEKVRHLSLLFGEESPVH